MGASDLDLGGGLKLARLLKKGYTGYFEGRTFRILRGGTLVSSFSDSQGRILTQLRQRHAMTPTQISDVVGSTPAAVIYNLKPLIKAGVVARHPLPGGTVFYVLCWDVSVDLSPSLKAKIEQDVSRMGGWSELANVPMGRLRRGLGSLSEDEFLEVMRYLVSGKNLAGRS
ncbi:MAG: winged helix-turn-helix domain-containing protein [Nitrososphaerales archaeon]